jgi:hypothetical protein
MKCKFGTGEQDITTCKMIYIHWPGYYPDDLYEYALKNLCPNYPKLRKDYIVSDSIRIPIMEGYDEEELMNLLTEIIQGARYHPELPFRKTTDTWTLDTGNNWWASLVRKGDCLRFGEDPAKTDELEVRYRYGDGPLLPLKAWLEYRFSPIKILKG